MKSILAKLMSIVFIISGWLPGLPAVFDSLSVSLTGVPCSVTGSSSGFLDDLPGSIKRLDENTGYVDDLLLVFLRRDTSFPQRYKIFRSIKGLCVGWFEPASLFVLKSEFEGLDEMNALCGRLMEDDKVVFACGSFAFKHNDDYTPSDPFDGLDTGRDVWDEANPGGSNWWLEAVEARNAWGYEPYFNSIKIGVVDSGFETTHPDLEGKVAFPNPYLEKQNRPVSHGTHVAGIITANANDIGIRGICSNAALICVDWEREEDQHWIEDIRIVFGVGSAVSAGAKIVNLSLGSSGSIPEGKSQYAPILMNAEGALVSIYMAALLDRGYDFIAVQSAGNGDKNGNPVDAINNGTFCTLTERNIIDGAFGISKRAILDRVMIVGSARNLGSRNFMQSGFSNVGQNVSICAPGSGVYSCDLEENGYYSYKTGTSMAAPVAAAVAGLVWSVNPSLTGAQVKGIVCDEANAPYIAEQITNGYWSDVPYRPYRMVNAKLSVEAALKTIYQTGVVTGRTVDGSGNPVECEITAVSHGKEFVFSSASDGYFRFLLEAGEAEIRFGDSADTVKVNAIADEEWNMGDILII